MMYKFKLRKSFIVNLKRLGRLDLSIVDKKASLLRSKNSLRNAFCFVLILASKN